MSEYNEDILVSIITVCRNSEKTIERTIESVLAQTYSRIEYIVIDGVSSDSTCTIIEGYIPKFEGRIKYVTEPDDGIYDAMNKGIRMASGQLIGIINSDDYYFPNAVQLMVEAWKDTRFSENVILHGVMSVLRNGKEVGVILSRIDNIYEKMIQHPTVFVPKAVYNRIGYFDLKYKYVADAELMMRAYEEGADFIPVYSLIAAFESGGYSEKFESLRERYKLSYDKKKIGKFSYFIMGYLGPLKSKIYSKIWK